MNRLRIVFLGLSITSSWGNGHATTYRGLIKALIRRGHDVSFLERDVPWYARHRDPLDSAQGRVLLYRSAGELSERFASLVRQADAVIVGSFVPEGPSVLRWILDTARGVVAFYDIDTPVTVAKLEKGDEEYLAADLIPLLDLYFSFTGGPLLDRLRKEFGAKRTAALYCAVDPDLYCPQSEALRWDLGYLGTFSRDRQQKLRQLLIRPAHLLPDCRFVVAGPQYPPDVIWPENVERIEHLAPHRHPVFYNAQGFTLNLTRADMVTAGWSPSVRLFEASACGTPIISDAWPGLDAFFVPGQEILVARDANEVIALIHDLPDEERRRIGQAARARVLRSHTATCRAAELEGELLDLHQGGVTDAARRAPALRPGASKRIRSSSAMP